MLLPNAMKIKVKYFAGFRKIKGKKEEIVDITENTTIHHLLEQFPGDEGKFVLINGIRKPVKYVLKEEDDVGVFPLIGGG